MDFTQITEMVYMYLPMITTIIGVLATFLKIGSALKKNVKDFTEDKAIVDLKEDLKNVKKQNEILSSQLNTAMSRTEELINEISKVEKYEKLENNQTEQK